MKDAIGALLAYWGWFCMQNDDGEDVLYDWLCDIIEWEIQK